MRGLCGYILTKIFFDILLCARLWWSFNRACVISVMKHLDMAAFDNQIPARLTGNVRRLVLTKGAYQLAFFLCELHCVDNTVPHLIHAVIVSTLVRAITVRITYSPIPTPFRSAVFLPTSTILQGCDSFLRVIDIANFEAT